MATQTQVIASADDGFSVTVEYNDATNRVTAIAATVIGGTLTIELTRGNQTRTYTLGAGTTRSTNVPNGVDLGIDPETGQVSFTRGNCSSSMTWSAT